MYIVIRAQDAEELFRLYGVLKAHAKVNFSVVNVTSLRDLETQMMTNCVLLFFPDVRGTFERTSFKWSEVDVSATGDIILGNQVITENKIISI